MITHNRRRLGWVLVLTSTAYFMVALDATVVATALPRMQADLHVRLTSLQWTLNSYGIASRPASSPRPRSATARAAASSSYRAGPVHRRVRRLRTGPERAVLIAARTVQGLGGAIVLPLSLTILTTAFPAERRGTIVGIYGGSPGWPLPPGRWSAGAVPRPSLALDLLDQRPVGVAARHSRCGCCRRATGPAGGSTWPESGWSPAASWRSSGPGPRRQAGWAARDRHHARRRRRPAGRLRRLGERVSQPMVPLRLFGRRAFAIGNATTFFMSGAIFAGAFLVVEEFQFARQYSPMSTGVRCCPSSACR